MSWSVSAQTAPLDRITRPGRSGPHALRREAETPSKLRHWWGRFITLTHDLTTDNRLVILDLADFIYPRISLANTEILQREAFILKGQSCDDFYEKTCSYLEDLSRRLLIGTRDIASPKERSALRKICGGMSIVLSEARAKLEDLQTSPSLKI